MLINKLKICKSIDLDSNLKEYISKNYDEQSISEKVKSYFRELSQCRTVMSQMGAVQDSIDQLKQNINIISSYINMLSAVKQKMTFGKESYSCKIEFTWTDTIKESKYSSYNVFFEIYNALFNLATCYYNLGTQLSLVAKDKSEHKEATHCFKRAMYLFDVIKEEANLKISEKEMPFDLFIPHLDYCKVLCELQGQLEIYHISKEASPNQFGLHAKLLNVVSELYGRARFLADGPQTKKGTKDDLLNFLANRQKYYKALMYKDLKDEAKKKFDAKGEGYGEVLLFQGLLVRTLLECQENIKKCGNLVDKVEFENMLKAEQNEGLNIKDLNDRVYHQLVPNEEDLIIDQKNMMSMVLPENLYIRENSEKIKTDEKVFCADLDLLVPKQVKTMIDNYKAKMHEFISKNLDQYENDMTVQNFVQNLFLPKKLTTRPGDEDVSLPPVEIPPQIWQKIEEIKKIGGVEALHHIMNNIMNKSHVLITDLENLLKSLEMEDKDDQMCRQQYGAKWIREPSQKLNFKLVQGAQQFIATLINTKKYDQQEYNEINDNAKYFMELLVPKEQLINKIPRKEEIIEKNIPEEDEVKKSIMTLYELCDKCMTIIKPIFNELNDDSNIVGQFIDVLAKKTTEQAIFEKYKEEYEKKFVELKPLSDEVKKQKEIVNQVVQKNSQKIREKPKPNMSNETIEYFKTLDQYCNMFMKKYEKIKKGDKYYNDIYEKIYSLLKTGNDWMIKRSDEKNIILGTIKGAQINPKKIRLTESALLDPKRNPFTNMNVNIGKK